MGVMFNSLTSLTLLACLAFFRLFPLFRRAFYAVLLLLLNRFLTCAGLMPKLSCGSSSGATFTPVSYRLGTSAASISSTGGGSLRSSSTCYTFFFFCSGAGPATLVGTSARLNSGILGGPVRPIYVTAVISVIWLIREMVDDWLSSRSILKPP